jgi:putative transposase
MMSFKYRLYPNHQQVQTLNNMIETCRLLYNQSLEERLKDTGLKYYEQKRALTQKRKTAATLLSVHSQVLQDVVRRLERAFQNYHRDITIGKPKFKRHDRYNSITYPQCGSFSIIRNRLKLAFIDGLIKIKFHRMLAGRIKTCTIIRDVDRWYACFSCDATKQKTVNDKTVGIDLGIHNWIALDNGQMIDRPRFLDSSVKKIKHLQRELSRKKRGSRHWQKAKVALSKAWRKVRLQRDDYCQKVTTNLAKRFQTIIFEKLSISKMVKNHRLAVGR